MKYTNNTSQATLALGAAVRQALEDCGAQAVTYAKSICPVDTGRLRASITHRLEGNRVVIGTDVEYAEDVELGTGRYRPGWTGPARWLWQDRQGKWHVTAGQRPQPYLRPAVSDHDGIYRMLIRQALEQE